MGAFLIYFITSCELAVVERDFAIVELFVQARRFGIPTLDFFC